MCLRLCSSEKRFGFISLIFYICFIRLLSLWRSEEGWGRVVADCISRVKQNIITFYNLIVLFYFLCFQVNISKKQQIIKTCKKILCLSSVFIPKRRGSDGRVIKINYGLERSRDLAFPTKFGHQQMIPRKCPHEERQLSELMPLTSA